MKLLAVSWAQNPPGTSSSSIAANTVRIRSLAIGPGKPTLTRMPRGPSSRLSSRDKALSAALGTV